MPELFIGNATRQIYDFSYRVTPGGGVRSQKIDPGSQVKISGDLSQVEIDYVLSNHAQYGLIAESEIDQSREFRGTCYSVGSRIMTGRLLYLMQGNLGELIRRGEIIRKVNAVAHSSVINNMLAEHQRETLPAMELTIQQENADPNNDVAQMSEGLLISADASAQPLSPGRRKRAA